MTLRALLGRAGLAALLAVRALSAAEFEFSHALHLGKAGLSCAGCHSGAAKSRQASDSNLPDAALCAACHNGQVAPPIDVSALAAREPVERGYRFDHQAHLALGNPAAHIAEAIDTGKYLGHAGGIRLSLDTGNACEACHRGLPESARVEPGAHLPRMADCLVCHDKIDNPFSCETCHEPGFPLKPADHSEGFIDRHSSGRANLDKISCQPCHGRKFTCMGCH